jgi:hypothetical protein
MGGSAMVQVPSSEFEVDSHPDAFGVANQDLAHRARAILREDQVAEQKYRRLARDVPDPSTDVVFGLLVRETEEHCELLQRIIEGNLDGLPCAAPAGGPAADGTRLRAACLDIQELAHGSRRHADQLRDLACAERGHGHATLAPMLDTLARDSDKHASLLLELACHLSTGT